jgi:hypothetical protein
MFTYTGLFGQLVFIIYRHWFREENGCCWLLESDIEKHDHVFYLLQPLEGMYVIDTYVLQSITTIIWSEELDHVSLTGADHQITWDAKLL